MRLVAAELVDSREILPGQWLQSFHAPELASSARAGQFLHVRTGDYSGLVLRRPFSVNTADVATGVITIHFRTIGRGTEWFTRLRPGDTIDVLGPLGRPFEVDAGGGAFYGPKIDLKIKDALGREWQCSTFQLDYQIPKQFGLEYVAQDGSRKQPIMIHRALLGSMERFIAVLIEHFAGAFPLWLAPVQARVLTVSDKAEAYAYQVMARLKQEGLRIEADVTADKLGAKIRRAQMEKIPYMVVVGEKDMAAGVVSPRTREGQQQPAAPLDEFARRLAQEAAMPVVGKAA